MAIQRQESNEFAFDVPRSKQIIVSCYVSAVDDPTMYDGYAVSALVIPRPPDRPTLTQ